MSLLEQVYQTIRRDQLIVPGAIVVVGVSGGADSLALLHLLYTLRDQLRCHIHVATLDHGLRGEQGAVDVKFVVSTCQAWDIPVTAGQTSASDWVARKADRAAGSEDGARRARYDFLARVAREVGADRVAVAHHANDQAETVLMRILRGSGLQGLSAMSTHAPLPQHPDLTVIRPLLTSTRAEIEAYCHQHDLHPREDETNTDTRILRNHLRHDILPGLESVNPQVIAALNQLADIAAAEDDYMTQQLQAIIDDHVTLQADPPVRADSSRFERQRISIPRQVFGQLHSAMQQRLLHWAAHQVYPIDPAGTAPERQISYVHIKDAVEIVINGQVGTLALLPNHLQVRVDYDDLVVSERTAPPAPNNIPLLNDLRERRVLIPGTTDLDGGWQLHATLTEPGDAQARLGIPAGSAVSLRTRRPGDRFAPLGLDGHTQKISDWMINRKVPRHLRDRLPLLLINGIIAAVVFASADNPWVVSHTFAVQTDTEQVVYFKLIRD